MFGVSGKVASSLFLEPNPGWLLDFSYYGGASVATNSSYQPWGLAFSEDGTKFYVNDFTSKKIYQYNMSEAWDVTTATDSGLSSPVFGSTTNPYEVRFSSDGTKLYTTDYNNGSIDQYTLSTPWNISTMGATQTGTFNCSSQTNAPYGLHFKPDGTKMYMISGFTDYAFQYTLSTPWLLSSASYDNKSLYTFSVDVNARRLFWSADGLKLFIHGDSGERVEELTASTAWDISTCTSSGAFLSTAIQDGAGTGCAFSTDGTKFFMSGIQTDRVYAYELPTKTPAYDADASTHIARLTTTDATDNSLHWALNALISGLKTDGIWNKVDILSVVHNTSPGSLLNLKGAAAGHPDATAVGSPFHSGNLGFNCNFQLGNYIDLGVTEASIDQYAQNDGHAFTYNYSITTIGWTTSLGLGWRSTSDESKVYIHPDRAGCGIQGVGNTGYINLTPPTGFNGVSILASNDRHVRFRDSTSSVTTDFTYTLDNTNTMKVGTSALASTIRGCHGLFSAWGVGAGLTVTELANYENRIREYSIMRGFDVY